MDAVDLHIIGALQVDGRASWRKIARVIDAPLRTVARRGNALLESGVVRMVLMPAAATVLLEVTAAPTRVDAVARALADRPHSIFVYVVGPPTRILVEEHCRPDAVADLVLHDVPAMPDVVDVAGMPALEYYRTLSTWSAGLLTPDQVAALDPRFGLPEIAAPGPELSAADRQVLQVLAADPRATARAIAERTGIGEQAARRRVTALLGSAASIRAVVRPADIGLSVSAFVTLRVRPSRIPHVAKALRESPYVRYAVFTPGSDPLLADVAVPSVAALRTFLTDSPWASEVTAMRTSTVIAAYKHSGLSLTR